MGKQVKTLKPNYIFSEFECAWLHSHLMLCDDQDSCFFVTDVKTGTRCLLRLSWRKLNFLRQARSFCLFVGRRWNCLYTLFLIAILVVCPRFTSKSAVLLLVLQGCSVLWQGCRSPQVLWYWQPYQDGVLYFCRSDVPAFISNWVQTRYLPVGGCVVA